MLYWIDEAKSVWIFSILFATVIPSIFNVASRTRSDSFWKAINSFHFVLFVAIVSSCLISSLGINAV